MLLKDTPVVTPLECPQNRSVDHLYVIQAPRRDELQAWLKERGIGTGIHYPVPVHLQQAMQFLGYKAGDLPVSERVVKEVISLPMYAELTDEAIRTVASSIQSFYNS